MSDVPTPTVPPSGSLGRRRLMSCGTNLLLFLFSTYVALMVLSVLLPVALPPWLFKRTNAVGIPEAAKVLHPTCGYRLKPGFDGVFEGNGPPIPLRTNSEGWRDEEFPPAGEGGSPRVLVLGDSITMGVGLPVEQRYADLLQQRGGAELDNCALSGYELDQVLDVAEEMLPRLQPDLVLYGLCLNDVRHEEGANLRPNPRPSLKLRIIRVLELRNLNYLVFNILHRRREGADVSLGMPMYEQRLMRTWRQPEDRRRLEANLDQLRALTEEHGARLAIVVFPYTTQFGLPPDHELRQPQVLLRDWAETAGVPLLDLFDVYEPHGTSMFLIADHCHPNAEGHALAADAVAAWAPEAIGVDFGK